MLVLTKRSAIRIKMDTRGLISSESVVRNSSTIKNIQLNKMSKLAFMPRLKDRSGRPEREAASIVAGIATRIKSAHRTSINSPGRNCIIPPHCELAVRAGCRRLTNVMCYGLKARFLFPQNKAPRRGVMSTGDTCVIFRPGGDMPHINRKGSKE